MHDDTIFVLKLERAPPSFGPIVAPYYAHMGNGHPTFRSRGHFRGVARFHKHAGELVARQLAQLGYHCTLERAP